MKGRFSELLFTLENLARSEASDDVRGDIRELVEAFRLLRQVGIRAAGGDSRAARARILRYLRQHPGQVIDGEELMVVAGIREHARRIRELRVEEGWPILSGHAAREMRDELKTELPLLELPPEMRPDQYMLQEDRRDTDAATRWKRANADRRSNASVQSKILRFFRENVGQHITSDELRYVAGDRSEWARRTRELRTEEGWPIVTNFTGDPSLPMGVYVLARDEQAPPHDRHIPEIVRREVMGRDHWSCRWRRCGWSPAEGYRDPRFLEVHHIVEHARGGGNVADNLVTLCNLHHDETHRTGRLDID